MPERGLGDHIFEIFTHILRQHELRSSLEGIRLECVLCRTDNVAISLVFLHKHGPWITAVQFIFPLDDLMSLVN